MSDDVEDAKDVCERRSDRSLGIRQRFNTNPVSSCTLQSYDVKGSKGGILAEKKKS